MARSEMERPFAPACERNREPIALVLDREIGSEPARILEIGAGTGQHAVYFLERHPSWHWQCTDQAAHLPGIQAWLDTVSRPPAPRARVLDVTVAAHWDALAALPAWDWIYTANTLHIMGWNSVQRLFERLTVELSATTGLIIYGPFHRADTPTSPSNLAFDADLRARDPHMGLRHLHDVSALAQSAGLHLTRIHEMPANNLLLVFRPTAGRG